MKQKLIALLKTSFASKGFNAKELDSLADLIISQNALTDESTDEDLSTAVTAAKPTADFVQSVASRQVSDVKKPKAEDPKPEPTPEPEPAKPTDPILALLQEMKSEIAAIKGEKVVNTWKGKLEETLKDSDPKFKEVTLKGFGRMKFDNEDQFNEYLAEIAEDSKVFVAPEQSFVSDRPTGSAGKLNPKGEASTAELDAVFDKIKI